MEIQKFTEILNDRHFCDYEKMSHKYGEEFATFLKEAEKVCYQTLPLTDSDGGTVVFMSGRTHLSQSAVKILLKGRDVAYGNKAAEQEILSTCAIESIDFSRDSVRNILKGYAPKDEQEERIMGLKKGFEFIAADHDITEENLVKLYQMTVGDFLKESECLLPGHRYRHDDVFVVSDRVEHIGMAARKVPDSMHRLIEFIHAEDDIDDLIKAAIIHFYFCYVHPYFDGNGRMARLLHLWFLIRKGYRSALFVPFSESIEKTRKQYYTAYTAVEQNKRYSKVVDITPFILYFAENVYNNMKSSAVGTDIFAEYESACKDGKVTQKETELWRFVLSFYGTGEFSTKQLEKEFGNAAYATIRGFVLKFEKLGLLCAVPYAGRTKYKIRREDETI